MYSKQDFKNNHFRMTIHKEGKNILLSLFVLLLLINAGIYHLAGRNLLFHTISIISISLFLIILNFFRNPKRIFQGNKEGMIIASADGTIVAIEEVMENEYFQEKRIQVSIFMTVFNVHANWFPAEGKVIHVSHQPGRFMAAYLPKSSTENERSTIVIETKNGEQILTRQIAGAMARRIITYAKVGKECHFDEQMGFIKFGSRVDIFLPLGTEIFVKPDQKVKGNQTPIAKLSF